MLYEARNGLVIRFSGSHVMLLGYYKLESSETKAKKLGLCRDSM